MQEKKEHLFGAIENWLRSVSVESLLELKEKCKYWREQTNNKEYYPYECLVWQFNKGPDGQEWGEETIRQRLNITKDKVHQSEWIGLHLLGWKATHSPAYKSRTRIANEIDSYWRKKTQAEKAHLREEGLVPLTGATETLQKPRQPAQKPVSLEQEILESAPRRCLVARQRVEEIEAIKESLEKQLRETEAELKQWQDLENTYKRVEEIEKEEESLIQRLQNKGRLKGW